MSGAKGARGEPGPAGPSGSRGPKGLKGDCGKSGIDDMCRWIPDLVLDQFQTNETFCFKLTDPASDLKLDVGGAYVTWVSWMPLPFILAFILANTYFIFRKSIMRCYLTNRWMRWKMLSYKGQIMKVYVTLMVKRLLECWNEVLSIEESAISIGGRFAGSHSLKGAISAFEIDGKTRDGGIISRQIISNGNDEPPVKKKEDIKFIVNNIYKLYINKVII